jgi:hypothetical protein
MIQVGQAFSNFESPPLDVSREGFEKFYDILKGFNFYFRKIENSPAVQRDGLSLRHHTLSLKL